MISKVAPMKVNHPSSAVVRGEGGNVVVAAPFAVRRWATIVTNSRPVCAVTDAVDQSGRSEDRISHINNAASSVQDNVCLLYRRRFQSGDAGG